MVFTSAVPSLRVASYPFPSKPPALGTWQECLPPPFPPLLQLPTTDLPQTGQPAQPKIATANKEMSSLGLLSSAGAHFFQLGFKLRNTSVCLVSARCQHFCSACSGATGRLMNSVGRLRETILYLFFFSSFAWNQGTFSVHLLEASGPRGQNWRERCSRAYEACLQPGHTHHPLPSQPIPTLPPPSTFHMHMERVSLGGQSEART